MKNPLVTILVYTYNGEKFIEEQLKSLISQTYKNIEILIFDDFSTDNTIQMIENFIINHPTFSIQLFKNNQNIGILKNVERSFHYINGKYIALCDQDDVWDQNKIKILVTNIKENILIYSNIQIMDKNSSLLNIKVVKNPFENNNYKAFWFSNYISGHSMLFTKELVQYLLPFPSKAYIHPDWYIAYIASIHGNIKYLDQTLVSYRQHDTQITKFDDQSNTKKSKIDKKIKILKALNEYQLNNYTDQDLLESLINSFEQLQKSYFDIKLYLILRKYYKDFFPFEKRKNLSFRYAKGVFYDKFNTITIILFLIYFIYYIIKR